MALIDQFIRLLDVIIWPLTILTILGWFKNELRGFFRNLKKIEAGADGFVLESFETQMSKTRELFPNTIASKSSKSIGDAPDQYQRDNKLSSQQQLKVWHDNLSNHILRKASSSTSDPMLALGDMKSSGEIRLDEYDRFSNLLKLTSMTSNSISDSTLSEICKYLNSTS